MAIYTRFGSRVEFTAARMIPVWIERLAGEIKWHYRPKAPTRRTKEIREEPVWHVTAVYDGGEVVCGGKWMNLGGFVADGGISEIMARCHELAPDAPEKFEQWSKADGPDASALFDPIEAKMVA